VFLESDLIEKEHLRVLGVTTAQRAERKKTLQAVKAFSSNDFLTFQPLKGASSLI